MLQKQPHEDTNSVHEQQVLETTEMRSTIENLREDVSSKDVEVGRLLSGGE